MKFILLSAVLASAAGVYGQSVSGVADSVCGNNDYSVDDIQAAADASLQHLIDGDQIGHSKYPHIEDNREGFSWDGNCNAPYYEFPVIAGDVYSGGSPGAYRVVIGSVDTNAGTAAFCDMVYHVSMSNSDFGQCSSNIGSLKIKEAREKRALRALKIVKA